MGAGAGRRVGVGEGADREEGGRPGHRERAVEVAVDLRVGAGEVEREPLALDRRRDPQHESALAPPRELVLEHVLGPVGAVGERGERGAGAALGVGEDGRHARAQAVAAVALGQLGEPPLAEPVRGRLGAQVGEPLVRRAHPRGEPLEQRRARRAVGGITTPSSSSVRETAGMPPGVGPPTSAWWARLAAKPISSPATKTGEIRVMSGRWVPPRNGSLRIQASPGSCSSPSTAATAAGIEPRWTGMCSACITSSPAASNSAVEQSWRSLMLAE